MSSLEHRSEHFLETNACSRLLIRNLLGTKTSPGDGFLPLPAVLNRRIPPIDLVPTERSCRDDLSPKFYLSQPPERPPSSLPPPRDLELRGSLGKYLGGGRVGITFSLDDVEVDGLPEGFTLPPLVVKIARRDRVASLAREAWFYDEMECIQGSVVPRCYGWFEAISAPTECVPVLEQFAMGSKSNIEGDSESESEDDSDFLNEKFIRRVGLPPLHPMLKDMRQSRGRISVLVLEQVGQRLQIKRAFSPMEKQDIHDLYKQLMHLGIGVTGDIRWENLAYKHPNAPDMVSPLIKRAHAFRLIDFDQAFKVDWSLLMFALNTSPDVTQLLVNIRCGDCGPNSYSREGRIETRRQKKAFASDCFILESRVNTSS